MFKRKTFNLVNEEEAKQRENLYEPKRCRWMKYIVIPAMVGFILLLILINVDFSDKTKIELSTVSAIGTTITGTELLTIAPTETMPMPKHSVQLKRSYNLSPNINNVLIPAARCKDQGGDRCTIICSNGNVQYLAEDLTELSDYCRGNGDISVKIDNCTFPSLLTTAFRGYFNLERLEITNSDLVEIVDGAFNIDSMSRLQLLNLNTTALTILTEKSFQGLKALQELNFSNVPSSSVFVGLRFLQPLAKTLQKVSLCQKSSKKVFDPLTWLDGNENYTNLIRVDLSGNNFANTLSQATFSKLVAVRELILADCSLTNLDMNTFAGLTETLEYLDLSSNALKTLDVSVLMKKNGLRLELYNNAWSCSCENYELIKALQAAQFTYVEEPLCVAPLQWQDKPLKDVMIQCREETPITQEPPSSTTPNPVETPTSSLESSPITNETTITPPLTVETPATTSTDETLPPSLETSPSSSTSAVTEETDGNEDDKTTAIANITTTSSPTKPTPPKPTPSKPPTPAPIELVCQDPVTSTNNTISIRNFDARFTVRTTSSSSVVLLISSTMQQLRLIYFTSNNGTYTNTTEKSSARSISDRHCERTSSTAYTIIHVENLVSNETYIFCLMPLEEHTISPFNCQSHHIDAETSEESTAWLLTNDQAWFLILIIFGIMLTTCLGLISVYWLLRWRPTWLRGCKRIIKADNSLSNEVYLLPKLKRKSSDQDNSSYNYNRNLGEMRSNLNLDFDSYDYMQFYKNLRDANSNRKIYTLSSILPPKEQAPAVPQSQSHTVSLQATLPAKKKDLIEDCDTDDYQSIDCYEQVF